MADRDPFIVLRLADDRAATLLAAADRHRLTSNQAPGWRRRAGIALVRLGEALTGERRDPAPRLGVAGAGR